MEAQVHQWNQQLAVCIPEAIAASIHLQAGMSVEIEVIDDRLILSPTVRNEDLNQLLARVIPENLHEAIETGDAIGQEIW